MCNFFLLISGYDVEFSRMFFYKTIGVVIICLSGLNREHQCCST